MYSKGFALFSSGGVNQGHEEVSDVGAVFGFEEGVFRCPPQSPRL